MGNFEFSGIGLAFLLCTFAPNLLWARRPPEGYDALSKQEPPLLRLCERVGQVLSTCMALCSGAHLRPLSARSLWLAGAVFLLVLYEACWVRYFSGEICLRDFYRNFGWIPVPLAVLPVAAFLLLGIYGRSLPLVFAVALLGIGHIGIHLRHRRTVFH